MEDHPKDTSPLSAQHPGSFEDFWLAYLQAHAKRETRVIHYGAAALGVLGVVVGVMAANLWFVVAGFLGAYGFGAIGHRLFEKNRIFVRGKALWSLACCFRMSFSALTGHLDEDIERAGQTEPEE